jgi:hypothetical protein
MALPMKRSAFATRKKAAVKLCEPPYKGELSQFRFTSASEHLSLPSVRTADRESMPSIENEFVLASIAALVLVDISIVENHSEERESGS